MADSLPTIPVTASSVTATTRQGQPVTIQLLGSGPIGDVLTYNVFQSGAAAPLHGTITIDPSAPSRAIYTPEPSFSGVDTFSYGVFDTTTGVVPGAAAMITVTVNPGGPDNHAPTATATSITVENPGQGDLSPTGTDPDGDILIFAVSTQPSHGTVSVFTFSGGTNFVYYPADGYTGPDSFTFTASDGALVSAPATVSVTVVPQRANTPPVSVPPPTVVTAQDTPVAITLTATDADGDPTFFGQYGDAQHGTVTGGSDGNFLYTPTLGYSGPDSFHYDVNDQRSTSSTYVVNITVTPAKPVDHAPVVTPFSVISASAPVAVTLLGSDPEGDPLTFATANGPSHGALSGTGANLIYTPNAFFSGTDSFTYTASDGTFTSTPAAVQITVLPTGFFPDPSVDASVSGDQKQASSKIVSPKLSTTGADRLVLAFVAVDGPPTSTASGSQKVSAVTGGGLTWTLVKRSNSTWGTAEVWQAHATRILSGAAVTAKFAKTGYDGSITVTAFANSAHAVGVSVATSGTKGAPSATLNFPAGGASLLWGVGHDWSRAATPVPLADREIAHAFVDKRVGDTFWTEKASFLYGGGFPQTMGLSSPTADRWQFVAVEIPPAGFTTLPTFPTATN